MANDKLKIFSGRANPALAESICKFLDTKPGQVELSTFADGECYIQILENVRGTDVFVVQPCSQPVA